MTKIEQKPKLISISESGKSFGHFPKIALCCSPRNNS